MTMRTLRTIAAVVLMLGFVVGSTYGQWGAPKMKVTVPFQFSIGQTTLSAGQYLITSLDDRVLVQEVGGRNNAITFAGRRDGKSANRTAEPSSIAILASAFCHRSGFLARKPDTHCLNRSVKSN